MSALQASPLTETPRRIPRPAPPALTVVEAPAPPPLTLVASPAPRRFAHARFIVTILFLLAAGMVGHLLMQTTLMEQGFELTDATRQANELAARQAILQSGLDLASTPQKLAEKAGQLGMVPNPFATYIDVTTGVVTGVNLPVDGTEVPLLTPAGVEAANMGGQR